MCPLCENEMIRRGDVRNKGAVLLERAVLGPCWVGSSPSSARAPRREDTGGSCTWAALRVRLGTAGRWAARRAGSGTRQLARTAPAHLRALRSPSEATAAHLCRRIAPAHGRGPTSPVAEGRQHRPAGGGRCSSWRFQGRSAPPLPPSAVRSGSGRAAWGWLRPPLPDAHRSVR